MITGCTGHVGFALSNLLKNYYKDNIYLNLRNKKKINIFQKNFDNFIFTDLLYDKIIIPPSVTTIINLAFITPNINKYNFESNIKINENLIYSIRKHGQIKKIINFSSMAIYSQLQDQKSVNEKVYKYSNNEYAKSKLYSEKKFFEMDIEYVYNLRLPAVLVNAYSKNFLTELIKKIILKENIVLYNPNNMFNNVIDLNILYNFILNLLNNYYKSDNINLGADKPIRLKLLIESIIKVLDIEPQINWIENDYGFYIDINNAKNNYEFKTNDTDKIIINYIKNDILDKNV